MTATTAAPSSNEDDHDMCWLCLEANHESGLPMRRDCSCRGGSGWAHFPCIVEYAKQRSEQWSKEEDPDYDLDEAWQTCPNCKQDYQNELAVELATEFVSFAEKKAPDDQEVQLKALKNKLIALDLESKHKEEAMLRFQIMSFNWKQRHTTASVELLLRREQQKVQKQQWSTMKNAELFAMQ